MNDGHRLIKFENSTGLAEWYNDKYTEMGGGWKIPKEEALRLIDWADFEAHRVKSLLDIGCGDGDFLWHVGDLFDSDGIDLSSVGIGIAKKNVAFANFFVLDIEKSGFADNAFDYLASIGSIEHVVHLDVALKECYRIMKSDGKFLCLVPNELWTHMDQPQEQTHTDEEWIKLFNAAGFQVIKHNRRNDLTDFLLIK